MGLHREDARSPLFAGETGAPSHRPVGIMTWAAAALFAAGLVVSAPQAAYAEQKPAFEPRAEAPEEYPEGPGRDETFYACTACHNFKLVAQQGMSRRQWNESIDLMIDRHNMQPVDPADRKAILDYLEATFPARAPANRPGWQNPFGPK